METTAELTTLGYIGVRSARLDGWGAFATRLLGMQQVDRAGAVRAFRMDHRKQRLIVTGDEGEGELRKGSVVTCEVVEVKDGGLEVKIAGTDLTAFIKRSEYVEAQALDDFCRTSDLVNFKRPREYVFVDDIPKSPVGKILRRLLVAGEYRRE